MKLLKLYKWIAGGMPDFTRPFQDNEALYKQAQVFWNKLDSFSLFIVLTFIVLGVFLTVWYYKPYNNLPGRHYKPIHWFYFLIATFCLTFLLTWGLEYIAVEPKLKGSTWLQIRIALGNAIYASGLYTFISWIWCQFNFPTNAYRFLKF